MNLLEAINELLDATADMEERPKIKPARKRLQARADVLRKKRETMAEPKCNCGGTSGRGDILKCRLPKNHEGEHECDGWHWPRTNWGVR